MCRARAWRGSGGGWTRAALWRRPKRLDLHRGPAVPHVAIPGGGAAPGTRWARGADAPRGSGWHQLFWLPPGWLLLVTLWLTSEVLSFMHDSDTRLHFPPSPAAGGRDLGGCAPPLLSSLGSLELRSWSSSANAAPGPFVVAGRGPGRRPRVPPALWRPQVCCHSLGKFWGLLPRPPYSTWFSDL